MKVFRATILAISVMAHVVLSADEFTDEVIKIGEKDCTCSFVFKVENNKVLRRKSRVTCPEDCRGNSGLIQLTSQDTGNIYKFKVRARKGKHILINPKVEVQTTMDGLLEGDMLLTTEQLQKLKSSLIKGSLEGVKSMKTANNALVNTDKRWPEKTIRYKIELSDKHEFVRNTLSELERKLERNQGSGSCIKFVESSSGSKVIVSDASGGCWSGVGYGNYTLNLGPGCMHASIVEHEFLHALGIFHTQSRWDRHLYIDIITENIIPGMEHNFNQYDSSYVTHYGLPYDYRSVMHYGSKAFSKNGKITIKTLDPTKQSLIGQRNGISYLDIELVRKMYDCQTKCCYEIKVIGYISGIFKTTGELHNDRPVYKQGDWCIYYGGHWKVEQCDWLYVHKSDNSQGYMWSKINVDCPNEVGMQWRYYSWQGASNSGPIEPSASVTCYQLPDCCATLNVKGYIPGTYHKTEEDHNGRAVYKQGDWCIYFGGHWKVEHCDWLYVYKSDNSQGYMWSKINVDCPNEVGMQWRYYSWQGGSDSGPIEPNASVTCG